MAEEEKIPLIIDPDKLRAPLSMKNPVNVGGKMESRVERVKDTIISLVKAGVTPVRAGEACDIPRGTFHGWMKRGKDERVRIMDGGEPIESERPYLELVDGIIRAEAESMSALVLSWFKEARGGDWKAAERFLAKRFPQEWGDNNTLKLEVGAASGQQALPPPSQEEDEKRKRAVLQALVDAGDLPKDVLNAWDGKEPEYIEGEVIEESTTDESA